MAPTPPDPAAASVQWVHVRHVLTGTSVVDWPRLLADSVQDVDAFLGVHGFDVKDPRDLARLGTLRDHAADYLRTEHRYRLPPEVLSGDPRDLFAYAAGTRGRRQSRLYACMLLKAIHVLHHLEGRELSQHLSLSAAEVAQMMEAKVTACVGDLRAAGHRILDFSGGQKTRSSLITKLLAKEDTIAAQIHDRIRFRMVVETREDLPRLIDALTRQLFPFNYVVPGQSKNDLLDPALWAHVDRVDGDGSEPPPPNKSTVATPLNEFSGATYQVINFVADIPLVVPPEVLALRSADRDLGRIIFSLVEMQLVDAATARRNEQGDNNHEEYKNRQKQRVRARLEQGQTSRLREG